MKYSYREIFTANMKKKMKSKSRKISKPCTVIVTTLDSDSQTAAICFYGGIDFSYLPVRF